MENEYTKIRKQKLESLKVAGVNPYPYSFNKKYSSVEALKLKIGTKKVTIAGRLMLIRDMGRLCFAHVQDEAGKIQIAFNEKEIGKEKYKFFIKNFDLGDFIGVEGEIFKTHKGEITILVKKFEMLCKALLPLPEKWHGITDKEERYRKRYLDLIMNPEVKEVFRVRSEVIDIIRSFLKEKSFLEVETPTLQSVYGGASATPFKTHLNALDIDLFLSISPELYLKRLVVGGYERVFTICKNFRNEGIDHQHNPEFTMLEFYYAYENYETLIKMTEDLFKIFKKKLKLKEEIIYQGKKIKLKTPFKRVTFRDLVLKESGVDINKSNDFEKLKKEIQSKKLKNVNISGCKHYGALLDELYKRVVRPNIIQPTILTHYPVEMIALAKRNDKDKAKINTFQLIIDGAEIIKAYDELNDPIDQEERLKEQARLLRGGDTESMPMDEDFVNALMCGMPPTAGYGLGIDRLVMLLTGQDSIRDVILFPFMRPEKD